MNLNKKRIGLVTAWLISLMIVATVVYVVYAQTASTFWITEGVYPSAPTYTIWRDGTTYFAKNAYGQIPSWGSGTNATLIINNAINASASTVGQWVFLTGGVFEIYGSIAIQNVTRFTGSGTHVTYLKAMTDNALIINGDDDLRAVELSHFTIDGSQRDINGIWFLIRNGGTNPVNDFSIHDIQFVEIRSSAINLVACFKFNIYSINIMGSDTVNPEDPVDYGMYLENCGGGAIFGNPFIGYADYGIVLNGGYDIMITGNSFYYWNTSAVYIASLGFSRAKIVGNKFHGYYRGTYPYHAISSVGLFDYSTIVGNTFDNTLQEAILLTRSQMVIIDANAFHNTASRQVNNTYSMILLNGTYEAQNTVHNIITDNTFYSSVGAGLFTAKYAIEQGGNASWTGYTTIKNNRFVGTYGTAPLGLIGTDNEVEGNFGYRTRNTGSDSGSTPITVTHDLYSGLTPNVVTVTPISDAGDFYVQNIGATTFQIAFDGGGSPTFYWEVEYKFP